MTIKTDGIISGLSTTALIKELSSAASKPKGLLETKINNLNTKNTAYSTLNTLMGTVKTSLTDIQKVTDFRSFSTTIPSAASSYFSATTTGSAIAGSYSVQITQLAKSDMHVLNSLSSSTSTIKDGTIKVNFNTSSGFSDITMTINSASDNNNLSTLASALDSKVGITSYVLNTGDASNPYRLVVLSEKTGEDFTFTLDYTGTGTTGASINTTGTSVTRVVGQDATATINTISVSSSTNVFSDAVSGLTITALGDQDDAGVAAQDIAVALDTSEVSTKIQTFTSAYNAIIDFYKANNTYNATTGAKGIFLGDSNARNMINQLRTTISSIYDDASFTNANNITMNESSRNNTDDSGNVISPINALSKMGITFSSSTGKLKYSETNFKAALLSQQLDVEAMFADESSDLSFSAAMENLITTYTTSTTGTIATIKSNTSDQIKSLQKQVTRWEARITAYEARLYKQFTAMEQMAGRAQTASSFLGAYFAPKTSSS
jgi:flagellar hook-associated protein 2